MKIAEKAYAAGFLDGEGSITIAKHLKRKDCVSPIYDLRILITGTNPKPLVWFKQQFGGSIMLRLNTGPRNKPLYQYCIAARKALYLLKVILSFLMIKKSIAKIAVGFQEKRMQMPGGRGRTLEELKVLETYRRKVLSLNMTHTKKGGKRRW